MYGAIFGDIIGSRFEFDRGGRKKEFELFTGDDGFTDDTVMTVAVADGLMKAGKNANTEEIMNEVIKSMQKWGKKYPTAGYGSSFINWLSDKNPKPYGSYGNGSAMRVSAAGWLYDSIERTREVARATALVSHNHPEGIKGAECTAAVIFLARTGASKEKIHKYVIDEFCYDISETLEQMRKRHKHIETCQDSMPKALKSFFEGESYEEIVRNAVSLGGDTDTIAAIAGAMGEAMYGIPVGIIGQGLRYLSDDFVKVIRCFNVQIGREENAGEEIFADNIYIKSAAQKLRDNCCKESLLNLLDILLKRMSVKGEVPSPMVDEGGAFDVNPDGICIGDVISIDREIRLKYDTMKDFEGKLWMPLFTNQEEIEKGDTPNINVNTPIARIIESGLGMTQVEGIVINPYEEAITLPKEILRILIEQYKENVDKNEKKR